MTPRPASLERYAALAQKTDDFFQRVENRYAASMQCQSGCHDCCHVQLSVTAIERAVIAEGLKTLPPQLLRALAEQSRSPNPNRCSALDGAGKCMIYAFRPLVCRSHGLPIRMSASLPIAGQAQISACFRNFAADDVSALAPDCILDQQTLSAILLVLNHQYAQETGENAEERALLASIFQMAAGSSRHPSG